MTTTYYCIDGNFVVEPILLEKLEITTSTNDAQIQYFLNSNPKGSLNFDQFCRTCADLGICFWKTDILKKETSFFDLSDNQVLKMSIE